VLGIVHAHDGELVVDSEPGAGTHIEVGLARAHELVASVSMPEDTDIQGSGLILLVDDEAAVRDVGKAMLESLGYTVDLAVDGAEALMMFESRDYAALVVDLVMPKADGREVLKAVRQRSPRLPVVLVSGYGALIHPESDVDTYTRFLSKPFRVGQLGATLHELITFSEPGLQIAQTP
jgi:CheY-like chemotaxis protein